MIIRDSFSKKIFRKANSKNLLTLKELQKNGVTVAPYLLIVNFVF